MALRSFLRRPHAERLLLLRALWLVSAARLALSLFAFSRVQRMFGAAAAERAAPVPLESLAQEPLALERIAWSVRTAARYVPRATCLVRALAVRSMMARHGYVGDLRIGVGRDGAGAFGAHAWVEHAGRVVIGEEERALFTELPAIDGR